MYKATAKDVRQLQNYVLNDKVVEELMNTGAQPSGHVIAYYMPSQANWSWQIGIYTINGNVYELLTRFGSVEGGRRIYTGTEA
jgi:hypothetical protein